MDVLLGVDGGGTKTLVMLADLNGKVLSRGSSGASNYQAVGCEAAQASLITAIQDAFARAQIPLQPARFMTLGMAGVGRQEDRDWLMAFSRNQNLARDFEVVTDAELLLWAGTPQGWGVGCISGTGSIAFGIDESGRKARAGGWGYLIGDEGSGYAIGVAALHVITQAADGRGIPTSLTLSILGEYKLSQPSELVGLVYQGGLSREEIARLSTFVGIAATSGDQAAMDIIDDAALSLSKAIISVARELEFNKPIPCALGGGVFTHQQHLVRKTIDFARNSGVQIDPVEIVQEPVIGAIKLARSRLT